MLSPLSTLLPMRLRQARSCSIFRMPREIGRIPSRWWQTPDSDSAPHEYPEELWDRVIEINLKGVWLCLKYEVIQMLRQGAGAIVNTSSGAGLVGLPQSIGFPLAGRCGLRRAVRIPAASARRGLSALMAMSSYSRSPAVPSIATRAPAFPCRGARRCHSRGWRLVLRVQVILDQGVDDESV